MRLGPLTLLWPGAFLFFVSFYLSLSALPLYAQELGVSDRAIGFVVGAFAFASMVMKPWAGWASDRFGRRPLMLAGSAIFIVSALGYAGSGGTAALVGVRLLHGSGMGLFPTAASAVVADLAPPARRGEVIGFFGAAANLAMACGPIAGVALAERLGFMALFGVSGAAALLAFVLVGAVPESLREPKAVPLGVTTALSRGALFPSSIVLLTMLTYGAQVAFLPIYAAQQGVNPGLFFLVFALVVAIVRGHAGRLSDRLGRAPVAAAGLVLASVAVATIAFLHDATGLAVGGALYGLGFGTAHPSLMAWCVDAVDPRDRGRAMGTFYTALELGISIGAMSAGLAVSAIGFAPTFVLFALTVLAGAGLALGGGRLRGGRA